MKLILLITAAFVLVALASGCATKKVMKDCEQINDSHLWMCKHQFEVWR